jgi:hypothetical protein
MLQCQHFLNFGKLSPTYCKCKGFVHVARSDRPDLLGQRIARLSGNGRFWFDFIMKAKILGQVKSATICAPMTRQRENANLAESESRPAKF